MSSRPAKHSHGDRSTRTTLRRPELGRCRAGRGLRGAETPWTSRTSDFSVFDALAGTYPVPDAFRDSRPVASDRYRTGGRVLGDGVSAPVGHSRAAGISTKHQKLRGTIV